MLLILIKKRGNGKCIQRPMRKRTKVPPKSNKFENKKNTKISLKKAISCLKYNKKINKWIKILFFSCLFEKQNNKKNKVKYIFHN